MGEGRRERGKGLRRVGAAEIMLQCLASATTCSNASKLGTTRRLVSEAGPRNKDGPTLRWSATDKADTRDLEMLDPPNMTPTPTPTPSASSSYSHRRLNHEHLADIKLLFVSSSAFSRRIFQLTTSRNYSALASAAVTKSWDHSAVL